MGKKCISMIGATGNLGVPVVKNLLSLGFDVHIIVRNREKALRLFGSRKNVRIDEADLNDLNALQKALATTEYLCLNLSTQTLNLDVPFASEREGVANILKAVNRDKIRQIIVISGLGAFDNVNRPTDFKFVPNIIRKQGHRLIKESGIPYTILHCSWFADSFILYRRKNMYSVIGDTKKPIYFTNCYSYSQHLARAIGNPAAFYREFPVQGNIGYTHPEAAGIFFSQVAPGTKVVILSGFIIRIMALFNQEMKFLKHMSDYFSTSKEEFLAEECETYKILGEPVLNLDTYARKISEEKFYDYLNS